MAAPAPAAGGGGGGLSAEARKTRTSFAATAMLRPSAPETPAVTMPTTRPWASTSGPPELPGLTAASVWTNQTSSGARQRPEKIPRVTEALRAPRASGRG